MRNVAHGQKLRRICKWSSRNRRGGEECDTGIAEDTMAENFANLMKDCNPPIQLAPLTASKTNKNKATHRHITVTISWT